MPEVPSCPKCLADEGLPGGDPASAHTRSIACRRGLVTANGVPGLSIWEPHRDHQDDEDECDDQSHASEDLLG